jgi:hypothetical protein
MRLPLNFAGLAALAVLATAPTWARACWEEAAQRYGISADLLYAVARVESNLNPRPSTARTSSAPAPTTSASCRSTAAIFRPCHATASGNRSLRAMHQHPGRRLAAVRPILPAGRDMGCGRCLQRRLLAAQGRSLRQGPRPIRLAGISPVARTTS